MKEYLKRARWAAPVLLFFVPMVWQSHNDPLFPRTWLESVLYVAKTSSIGIAIGTSFVVLILWAGGVFDKRGRT